MTELSNIIIFLSDTKSLVYCC